MSTPLTFGGALDVFLGAAEKLIRREGEDLNRTDRGQANDGRGADANRLERDSQKGARPIRIWLRPEAVLETAEARAESEVDPERKRALNALAGALHEVGVPVVAEVLAAAARKTLVLRPGNGSTTVDLLQDGLD